MEDELNSEFDDLSIGSHGSTEFYESEEGDLEINEGGEFVNGEEGEEDSDVISEESDFN